MQESASSFARLWPLPPVRFGGSLLERIAGYRVLTESASMPASVIIKLCLWPDSIADFAREAGINPTVAQNALRGFKEYRKVRVALAKRLGVPIEEINHLVDAETRALKGKLPPIPQDEDWLVLLNHMAQPESAGPKDGQEEFRDLLAQWRAAGAGQP
jgi:lambda repressor-like predicted transcriptional regulator